MIYSSVTEFGIRVAALLPVDNSPSLDILSRPSKAFALALVALPTAGWPSLVVELVCRALPLSVYPLLPLLQRLLLIEVAQALERDRLSYY